MEILALFFAARESKIEAELFLALTIVPSIAQLLWSQILRCGRQRETVRVRKNDSRFSVFRRALLEQEDRRFTIFLYRSSGEDDEEPTGDFAL
jgi:hypothetical protein